MACCGRKRKVVNKKPANTQDKKPCCGKGKPPASTKKITRKVV